MPKVLILSASTGGGHNSAANALKDSLEKYDIEVILVDSLKFVSPILDNIVSQGYEKSAKYIPSTFGVIYKISSGKRRKKDVDIIIRRVLGRKIFHLVENIKPDVIIGTHPFPLMSLMKYKENGDINIPIISVLTDYTAHPLYIQKNIDAYITGHEDISYVLKKSGVDESKIYPFGIPISSNFLNTDRVEQVRESLGLENKFTVILMGGSFGAGNLKDNLTELLSSSYDFQIVVVTGRDTSLKEKLEKILHVLKPSKTVKILGFTKDMPELMTIAHVIITKPGGLTTTEAIIKGLPMVIPFYIPGQEAENVDFLLNNGLALKTFKNYPLSTIIEILMDNPNRRQEIIDRMLKRRKIDSADRTAELVSNMIKQKNN